MYGMGKYLNNAAYWLIIVDLKATEFTISSRLLDF